MKPAFIVVASLTLSLSFSLHGQVRAHALPQAKVTVRAVDESGIPLQGVRAKFGFSAEYDQQAVVWVEGDTDTNGLFAAQGFTIGNFGGQLTKIGYYLSGPNLGHTGKGPIFRDSLNGRFQPWNATNTTIMRKIENPVPVYAKTGWTEIRRLDKPCGYDLEAGDWVAPLGKGTIADFIFTVHMDFDDVQRHSIKADLRFSSAPDGIQETQLPKEYAHSKFQWPRLAPESGYLAAWESHWYQWPGKFDRNASDKQRFYFRVRTVERDGKIVSALYGKIVGGFELAPYTSKPCLIRFAYYLNPTSLDRNMEFDLTKNLFTNLKPEEQPRDP